MPPSTERGLPGPWISVHELAEWVYCPRAHFYARTAPPGSESPAATAQRIRGRAFHDAYLGRELARTQRASPWWVGAAVGVALLIVAILLLGAA